MLFSCRYTIFRTHKHQNNTMNAQHRIQLAARLYRTWLLYHPKDKSGALEAANDLLDNKKERTEFQKLIAL